MRLTGDLHGMRILLAEDDSFVAMDIAMMLEELGVGVIGPVASLDKLREAVGTAPIDGAILDVNLRGEPVFALLPDLEARRIPVVLSSGYDDPAQFPEDYRRLPRLLKPYTLEELLSACLRTFRPA